MWGDWEYLSPRRHAEVWCVFLQARSLCKSNVWRICLWFHFRRFVLVPWLPIKLKNNNSWSKPSENLHQRRFERTGVAYLGDHCPPVSLHFLHPKAAWSSCPPKFKLEDWHGFDSSSLYTYNSRCLVINLNSRFNFSTVASNSCFPNLIQRSHSSSPDEWAGTSETRSRNLWFPHAYIWPLEGSAGPAKSLGALLHLRPHLGRHCRT